MITTETMTQRVKEYYCDQYIEVSELFEVVYSEEIVETTKETTNNKLVTIAFPKQDGVYSIFYIKEYPVDIDDEIIYQTVFSWLDEKQYEAIMRVSYYKTDDNFDVVDYYY